MNVTVRISDDYEPRAGDVVLMLVDGAMYTLRLRELIPNTYTPTMWAASPTEGLMMSVIIDADDILGEVVG